MEELEINPEGEAPQQPAGESPDRTDAVSPDETEAASPDQTEPATKQAEETPPVAPVPMEELPAQDAEAPEAAISMEELLATDDETPEAAPMEDVQLMAVLEAVVYVAEEPLTLAQIAAALRQPSERVDAVLRMLIAELEKPEHGIAIREVAGGFKMATKAEHHEAVRSFVKSLKPPMKLSLPALETLAVIAYKQPVTAPEVSEIRGVESGGVLGSLMARKLIATAGRKQVIGRPILYKTTKEFLLRFGLKDLAELPSMEEFEKIAAVEIDEMEPAEEVASENASNLDEHGLDGHGPEEKGPEETGLNETSPEETSQQAETE